MEPDWLDHLDDIETEPAGGAEASRPSSGRTVETWKKLAEIFDLPIHVQNIEDLKTLARLRGMVLEIGYGATPAVPDLSPGARTSLMLILARLNCLYAVDGNRVRLAPMDEWTVR